MSRERLLPEGVRAAVVTSLYAQAVGMNWEALTPQDRTRAYVAWIDDPDVGKVLASFMTPEQSRSWIKDGPMKEYARAMRGQGRFAAYGRSGGTSPTDIVRHALGEDAAVIDGSIGTKPAHCLAVLGEALAFVTWGDAGNFRNLLWAALRASVDEGHAAHIVVLAPPTRAVAQEDASRHQRFAARCGVGVHHMREIVGKA